MDPQTKEMLFRLLLGAVYGGAIGFERQINGRPAGFRTHLLVCVASVLLMELSESYQYYSTINSEYIRIDPGRIAAGAITGIGFIGAGVIIRMGANVLGLTTAASLWMVSAIGFSVGAGIYIPSAVAFGITIFSLFVLRLVERITPGIVFKSLTIKADRTINEELVKDVIHNHHASLYRTDYETDTIQNTLTMYYTLSIRRSSRKGKSGFRPLIDDLSALDKVQKVSLRA